VSFDAGKVEASLGAKVEQRGFREFDAYLAAADKKIATAKLKADVPTSPRSFERRRGSSGLTRRQGISTRRSPILSRGSVGSTNSTAFQSGFNLIQVSPRCITGLAPRGAGRESPRSPPGAVGLTSALAPLSGLLVEYPALLTAVGQAAGVVALWQGNGTLTQAMHGNHASSSAAHSGRRRSFMDHA
jgi:hypothetical protein